VALLFLGCVVGFIGMLAVGIHNGSKHAFLWASIFFLCAVPIGILLLNNWRYRHTQEAGRPQHHGDSPTT
jgi:hypothetical protein